jgi:hypothetical protein
MTGVSSTFSIGSITPADVMGVTGVESTFSVGSITPADVMGVSGQSITSSLGSISPDAQVMGLEGRSLTSTIGSISITTNPIIIPTGLSTSLSVGSINSSRCCRNKWCIYNFISGVYISC